MRQIEESFLELSEEEGYRLCKQVAKKLFPFAKEEDFQDHVHNGFIGLMDARSKFDAEQKEHFKSYAGTRIKGAILDAIRNQRGRKGQKDILNFYAPEDLNNQNSESSDTLVSDLDIYFLQKVLTEEQFFILNAYLSGYKIFEIARELGYSNAYISLKLKSVFVIAEAVNFPESENGKVVFKVREKLKKGNVSKVSRDLKLHVEFVRAVFDAFYRRPSFNYEERRA